MPCEFIDQVDSKILLVFLDQEHSHNIVKNWRDYPVILYQQSQKSQRGFFFIFPRF